MIATQSDNAQEMFPIVDEEGRIVGAATRGQCHDGRSMLLHPVVHLHVFNSRGELFLQRRPAWKDIQPGKWDTAVGGHVDLGENVTQALLREAMEELGLSREQLESSLSHCRGAVQVSEGQLAITSFTPERLEPYVFQSERERELVYPHRCTYDGPVTPSAETDGGRFWTRSEILASLGKGIFTPNFEHEYRRLFL